MNIPHTYKNARLSNDAKSALTFARLVWSDLRAAMQDALIDADVTRLHGHVVSAQLRSETPLGTKRALRDRGLAVEIGSLNSAVTWLFTPLGLMVRDAGCLMDVES